MHVLLIEPNTVLAASYVAALEAAQHTVVHARTAQQAVMAADKKAPELVILELQMARHNGIEFLYEFKSYVEWQHIPVVVLTVLPPAELKKLTVLGRELGVSAVLGKSTSSLADLCAVVETVSSHNL